MVELTRGFTGRRRQRGAGLIPPGQFAVDDFPVLTAGPTPRIAPERWDLTVTGEIDRPRRWTWEQFRQLPREQVTADIHCVTRWSKLDTAWEGVSVDVLLDGVETTATHVVALSEGGYTTNLPLADVTDGRAWIVDTFDGAPLAAEHGGPARLLVPHLYLWKSAKWVRELTLLGHDEPGFWETIGYHDYGDPWRQQRYAGD